MLSLAVGLGSTLLSRSLGALAEIQNRGECFSLPEQLNEGWDYWKGPREAAEVTDGQTPSGGGSDRHCFHTLSPRPRELDLFAISKQAHLRTMHWFCTLAASSKTNDYHYHHGCHLLSAYYFQGKIIIIITK